MAKWICKVCGYVHEGDTPPEECPVCHVKSDKFEKMGGDKLGRHTSRVGNMKIPLNL